MRGDTARVARLVRAYRLLEGAEKWSPLARREVLRSRIQAVLPQLTPAETAHYYEAIHLMRFEGR